MDSRYTRNCRNDIRNSIGGSVGYTSVQYCGVQQKEENNGRHDTALAPIFDIRNSHVFHLLPLAKIVHKG